MDWQDKYLSPPIESERIGLARIGKFLRKYFVLIKHSLRPHLFPAEPKHELPQLKSVGNLFAFCERIYQESLERINKLEQKAFNLLSYITAVFAFLTFIFLQAKSDFILKIVLTLSMFMLLFSIIISYRCSNVKITRRIFLPDIYDLENDPPKAIYDDEKASITFLKSAVFNGNVADNLADMLNAARYILMTALVVGFLGSGIIVSANYFASKHVDDPQIVLIKELRDSALVLEELLRAIDTHLEDDTIQQSILSMSTRLDSLSEELLILKQNLEQAKQASAPAKK